jgi:hypothetical protein
MSGQHLWTRMDKLMNENARICVSSWGYFSETGLLRWMTEQYDLLVIYI